MSISPAVQARDSPSGSCCVPRRLCTGPVAVCAPASSRAPASITALKAAVDAPLMNFPPVSSDIVPPATVRPMNRAMPPNERPIAVTPPLRRDPTPEDKNPEPNFPPCSSDVTRPMTPAPIEYPIMAPYSPACAAAESGPAIAPSAAAEIPARNACPRLPPLTRTNEKEAKNPNKIIGRFATTNAATAWTAAMRAGIKKKT